MDAQHGGEGGQYYETCTVSMFPAGYEFSRMPIYTINVLPECDTVFLTLTGN